MQLLIGAGLAGVAFLIPMPFFFQATLAIFWLIAFSSATHDIAADGFYMLALDSPQQSFFVGIRSTFYRIAMNIGTRPPYNLAGAMERITAILNYPGALPFLYLSGFLILANDLSTDVFYHARYAIPQLPKTNASEIFRRFGLTFEVFSGKKKF
jgi:PAT family beta-lactamase induction signal transducer AmpG